MGGGGAASGHPPLERAGVERRGVPAVLVPAFPRGVFLHILESRQSFFSVFCQKFPAKFKFTDNFEFSRFLVVKQQEITHGILNSFS